MKKIKKILVTGSAGFIGMHASLKFLEAGFYVLGIDNLNSYYDKKLKLKRLQILKRHKKFKFIKLDIANNIKLNKAFRGFRPDYVINLAAQVGVRYSISNPKNYTQSNLVGFANILDYCKIFKVKHLLFASSSSVYGNSISYPFSEKEKLNSPISYYAATKLSNEVMAHSYSHLHKLPTTGLRFFTVYGPWGRPDMALSLFAEAIKKRKKLKLFNSGNMIRDFTYIDDIVSAIIKISKKIPKVNSKSNKTPFRILNIGSNKPIRLKNYVNLIEKHLNKKGKKVLYNMQKGDLKQTYASLKEIKKLINYSPKTSISVGIKKFITWHNSYYGKGK